MASQGERTKCSITLRPLLLSLFVRGGVDCREGHPAAERVVLWGCNCFENGEPFSHLLEALYGLAAAPNSCGLPLLGSTPLLGRDQAAFILVSRGCNAASFNERSTHRIYFRVYLVYANFSWSFKTKLLDWGAS